MASNDKSKFPKVVIVGGGFGGLQVAKKLKDEPVDVLMVDKQNYHTFQPLLYQVATGSLEPDSIAFFIAKKLRGAEKLPLSQRGSNRAKSRKEYHRYDNR